MTDSRKEYIEKYSGIAMEHMRQYGIPASIILAQGIIESADGRSMLAQTANNHFGVKGEYNGAYVLADDDRPNERFKKYDDVSQSFEDHSKLLLSNRYQQYVNHLAPDDYKGWAEGIKAGGYATGRHYASTLCSVIESCNLQQYDQMVLNRQVKGQDLSFSMPVRREQFMLITSEYGSRKDPLDEGKTQIHHGIDIQTCRDAILATENNGRVIQVNHNANTEGGKSITLEYQRSDGSRARVRYMHLSDITVKVGDMVHAGQEIGVSGNTGTRTTGEHLHLSVIRVSGEGQQQWVNPAAYLAQITEKGNLKTEVLYNGTDLLARYRKEGDIPDKGKSQETEVSPEGWMDRLLSSPDTGLGFLGDGDGREGQGLLGSLMQMFMALLMLSVQQEGRSREAQMENVTDAVLKKKIDISTLVPRLPSAELCFRTDGRIILTSNDGRQDYSHELTEAERTRISQILNSDVDDGLKRQRMASVVNAITFSQQAARNYDQLEAQAQSQYISRGR